MYENSSAQQIIKSREPPTMEEANLIELKVAFCHIVKSGGLQHWLAGPVENAIKHKCS